MEPWLVILLLFQTGWNVFGKTHSLHKRGILELAGAVQCAIGRSPFAYVGYGCYCGPGGRGWPRDRTDWCCHAHDCCYDILEEQGCNPILWRYKWTCMDNTMVCGTSLDRCRKLMCECDREAVKCWKSAPFNRRNILWPDFWCDQSYPTCGREK